MANKTLLDVNGKESSKRLWASRYLGVGLAMGVIYFLEGVILSALERELTHEFPLSIWYGIIGTGAASIGLTIFESKVK